MATGFSLLSWGQPCLNQTTSEGVLAGVVKQVDGRRLLVRPVFERVRYPDGVQPACMFTFGLGLDFTGLSEGAYSVGIAPTLLERLLD